MNIRFRCMNCGRALSAPPKASGRKLKCPGCRLEVTVPPASSGVAGSTATSATPANQVTPIDGEQLPSDHALLLFPPRDEGHGDLIDMTAMVDIVFFLLIFFMVTSMQALEAVINLPTPQASENASSTVQAVPDYANDPTYVVVTIDADDAVFVDDGDEVMSEQDLRAKLRAALREGGREGMLIKGAGDATHGKFVMVLDAGADAGVKELLFSVDQTDEEADGG